MSDGNDVVTKREFENGGNANDSDATTDEDFNMANKGTRGADSDETTDDEVVQVVKQSAKRKHPAVDSDSDGTNTDCGAAKYDEECREKRTQVNGKQISQEKKRSSPKEVSAEDFFSGRLGGSSKKQKRTPIDLSASSEEEEMEDKAVDDADYVAEMGSEDEFEVGSRKKQIAKPRRAQQQPNSDSEDGDDSFEPESQLSLVTASSVDPSPLRKASPRRRSRVSYDDDSSDVDADKENGLIEAEKTPNSTPSKRHSAPAATPPRTKQPPTRKSPVKKQKEPLLRPTETLSKYSSDLATPECLAGLTFVFTGVMPCLSRDDAEDFVKILGGRVTKAVSSRTDYLVIGDELEDGRDVEEGSKYRKAKELGENVVIILKGEGELYALTKMLDERKRAVNQAEKTTEHERVPDDASPPNSTTTAPKARTVANPYARKRPGAAMSNSYAKKAAATAATSLSVNLDARSTVQALPPAAHNDDKQIGGGRASVGDTNALWADKYAPRSTRDILGNQEAVRKLTTWLDKWERTFNNPRAIGKSFGAPSGPWKAALLSGPPGIGKTTTALLVAKESGREVLELNASDTRSKRGLSEGLGDVTGSQVLSFGSTQKNEKKGHSQPKHRVVIMDEVDGMGAGDRSGMAELIKMIKGSMVPIICICNDRQSQKMRSLVPYCLDLRYRRPVKTVIARRAVEVGQKEGMRVETNAAEAIAESCGNDIRQVLNCLQMWSNKAKDSSGARLAMTYKDVKERQSSINKDEILRVSMFDATRMIVEGRKGLGGADQKAVNDSIYKRSDAFFVDYSLMGLNVHQNYLKVMISQFQETKRQNDMDAELKCVERMHEATQSMSDFAIAENVVRGGDQVWALLPLCSILAVKTGHHAGGENGGFLPGYPEFAGWLGKNSSRGKMTRLLQELSHHMNYKVSADSAELRLRYVPALRERFMHLTMDKSGKKIEEVIQLLDDYGLDRDDLFENLDEFSLDPKANKFANLDSKSKAMFTREYNKGVHKSQALVAEQGVGKKRKQSSSDKVQEAKDIDVINEDPDEPDGDESEELDAAAISNLFKKKGKGKGKPAAKRQSSARRTKGSGKKKS